MSSNTRSASGLPLITIGMTCFNAADTIERAIGSALAQDWPHIEVLVVDDGSTDESAVIGEKLAGTDPRIRYLRHEENKGYAGALNTIFDAASGDFVAIFDDDDVSHPDRLSKQWHRLTGYEQTAGTDKVFCYSNRDVFKDESTTTAGRVPAIGRVAAEPRGPDVADYILWHYERPDFTWGQFGSCTMLVRKRTVVDLGGFDESFRRSAEWDLAIRAAFAGAHFIAVNESLVDQHITPTVDKSGKRPLEYALKLRDKHEGYLRSRGVYSGSRAIARARFHYAKDNQWASRFYLAVACLLSPVTILPNEWRKRSSRKGAGTGNE